MIVEVKASDVCHNALVEISKAVGLTLEEYASRLLEFHSKAITPEIAIALERGFHPNHSKISGSLDAQTPPMTRDEARKRVIKLRALSERAGSPAEASTAKQAADKLVTEHSLTSDELNWDANAAAFDDLADRLGHFVKDKEVPSVVMDVILRVKTDASAQDKTTALRQILAGVRVANLFASSNATIKKVSKTVESVLLKHRISP